MIESNCLFLCFKHEIKIATSFLSDEKDRLAKELANANRTVAQCEDSIAKKEEQIRDLSAY